MAGEKEERALDAAREVFLRYGFKRVTMGDIAEAAQMSRPALYLLFASKEEIFTALMSRMFADFLAQIREGIDSHPTPQQKLAFAFEIWNIRPFEMIRAYPDSRDMLESTQQFAGELMAQAYVEFERIVAGVLEPLMSGKEELSARQIAHIMTSATKGFKGDAKDVEELREMVGGLIGIVLGSLGK